MRPDSKNRTKFGTFFWPGFGQSSGRPSPKSEQCSVRFSSQIWANILDVFGARRDTRHCTHKLLRELARFGLPLHASCKAPQQKPLVHADWNGRPSDSRCHPACPLGVLGFVGAWFASAFTVPLKLVESSVSQYGEEIVEMVQIRPTERLQQRIVEHICRLSRAAGRGRRQRRGPCRSPRKSANRSSTCQCHRIFKSCVKVLRLTSHERVQRRPAEHIVPVPVPQVLQEIVEVVVSPTGTRATTD